MERMYTYKFRLYPDDSQKVFLSKAFGCCRLVYNHFLHEKQEQYKSIKTSDNYNTQSTKLTQLRKNDEFSFLSDIPLQVLQCSLRNMHIAYDNFYKHRGHYPKYKSKRDRQAFKIAQPNTFRIIDGKLYIPKLKSGIDVVVSKEVTGKACFATVSRNKAGKYFVSITVRQDDYQIFERTGKSVGLDLGIKDLVITSDGVKYASHRKRIKQLKRKLKHNQRHLSRKVHGSKRYEKQVLKCNRLYEKITNVKADYIHKISTELVRNYDMIKVEDLNVKGMMKNHRLAEAIGECNWNRFVTMLQYKCGWHGKELIKVARFYPSSQTCSECGFVEKKVKNLNVREWTCPCCGCHHDRDVNAARNILRYNSARSAEHSRGAVHRPCGRACETSDRAGGVEAMNELLVL